MLRLHPLLVWSLICATLLAPAGAAARHAQPASPASAYLFVEIWTEVSGTGTLPALCIDFPGYQFEPNSGRMARFFEPLPKLLLSDLGFLRLGQCRTGAAGGGASSQLAPIASLPYTTTIALGTGSTS